MRTLIAIDLQNDFIDGSLGTPEAVAIIKNAADKISEYSRRGDEIIFTRDTHESDYLSTQEGRLLPVAHCIRGTHGWQIRDGLDIPSALHIDKPTFGWTRWNEMRLEDVEIIGLCTDICVVSNALIIKAMFPDINITVDSACCAGVTPESHAAALQTMKMCQINVI